MPELDRRVCKCGHRAFDHLGGHARCDSGSHRCFCSMFRECDHPEVIPFKGGLERQCTVCRNVLDRIAG